MGRCLGPFDRVTLGMDNRLLHELLAQAEAELAEAKRQTDRLRERAQQLEAFIASTRRIMDEGNTPRPTFDGARGSEEESGQDETLDVRRRRSRRRRQMQEVVGEACELIGRAGRPLTAAEVLAHHSARDAMTSEQMYRTLRKRVDQGRLLVAEQGRFWLRDRASD